MTVQHPAGAVRHHTIAQQLATTQVDIAYHRAQRPRNTSRIHWLITREDHLLDLQQRICALNSPHPVTQPPLGGTPAHSISDSAHPAPNRRTQPC